MTCISSRPRRLVQRAWKGSTNLCGRSRMKPHVSTRHRQPGWFAPLVGALHVVAGRVLPGEASHTSASSCQGRTTFGRQWPGLDQLLEHRRLACMSVPTSENGNFPPLASLALLAAWRCPFPSGSLTVYAVPIMRLSSSIWCFAGAAAGADADRAAGPVAPSSASRSPFTAAAPVRPAVCFVPLGPVGKDVKDQPECGRPPARRGGVRDCAAAPGSATGRR